MSTATSTVRASGRALPRWQPVMRDTTATPLFWSKVIEADVAFIEPLSFGSKEYWRYSRYVKTGVLVALIPGRTVTAGSTYVKVNWLDVELGGLLGPEQRRVIKPLVWKKLFLQQEETVQGQVSEIFPADEARIGYVLHVNLDNSGRPIRGAAKLYRRTRLTGLRAGLSSREARHDL